MRSPPEEPEARERGAPVRAAWPWHREECEQSLANSGPHEANAGSRSAAIALSLAAVTSACGSSGGPVVAGGVPRPAAIKQSSTGPVPVNDTPALLDGLNPFPSATTEAAWLDPTHVSALLVSVVPPVLPEDTSWHPGFTFEVASHSLLRWRAHSAHRATSTRSHVWWATSVDPDSHRSPTEAVVCPRSMARREPRAGDGESTPPREGEGPVVRRTG